MIRNTRQVLLSAVRFAFVVLATASPAVALPPTAYFGFDLYTVTGTAPIEVGSQNGGTPVAGGQAVGDFGFGSEARLWTPPTGNLVNLHPMEYLYTAAAATDGVHQVGHGYTLDTFAQHPLLWSGTANSAVDLFPTNLPALDLTGGYATGVSGNQQVGAVSTFDFQLHATLWNGTANSAVDLTPTTLGSIGNSVALATDGLKQGGFVNRNVGTHAVLWTGTASSAIDLHPTNLGSFNYSVVNGLGGGQQVGTGNLEGVGGRALLWTGSANSAVDLQPTNLSGFVASNANGTDGTRQVGYGTLSDLSTTHAMLWNGTANSAVDLQLLLPAGFTSSIAYSIDNHGNIFGTATDLAGSTHVVQWSPVPEPSTLILAFIATAAITIHRRTRTI